MNNHKFVILVTILLSGCVMTDRTSGPNAVDQLPMYGGMDRSMVPELQKADNDLIIGVTGAFGSRENAAKEFINTGFAFYNRNNFGNAMRRFNQAWLLDPKNPEVYWGFSAVLHDQQKFDLAYDMARRAYDLGFRDSCFLADIGRLSVLRFSISVNITADQKAAFIAESESYYFLAQKSGDRLGYIYDSWASAKYLVGDYAEAWKLVRKSESFGGTPSYHFFYLLGQKMPEPNSSIPPISASLGGETVASNSSLYLSKPKPAAHSALYSIIPNIIMGTVLIRK
jgi:hypothetical protein